MTNCVTQYFRCPREYDVLSLAGPLSEFSGYFRFGPDTIYGRYSGSRAVSSPSMPLHDALLDSALQDGYALLPFDLSQVVQSLLEEQYVPNHEDDSALSALIRHCYYALRPALSVGIRKHLQKCHLRGWEDRIFPTWPVDRTVDNILERALLMSLRSGKFEEIPFVWYWPEGAPGCAIMTHDVETDAGMHFCNELMDLDESYGIPASFQVVPEERYQVTPQYLESIRGRGFGLAVQDLNHDGLLYKDYQQFTERVRKINEYGRKWKVDGFRAAVLYRRQAWFEALEFSYDMSVPNVAHLDPQHGGCCTVKPYFVGKILELPVTTTQDYTLFHILNDHSIDLWKQQLSMILEKNGLASFIVHPDYVMCAKEQRVYGDLLGYISNLRSQVGIWVATADEVSQWWRQRAKMELIKAGDHWSIHGPGSERARVAFAREEGGRLIFSFATSADNVSAQSPKPRLTRDTSFSSAAVTSNVQ